jgi:hypothetical protein
MRAKQTQGYKEFEESGLDGISETNLPDLLNNMSDEIDELEHLLGIALNDMDDIIDQKGHTVRTRAIMIKIRQFINGI